MYSSSSLDGFNFHLILTSFSIISLKSTVYTESYPTSTSVRPWITPSPGAKLTHKTLILSTELKLESPCVKFGVAITDISYVVQNCKFDSIKASYEIISFSVEVSQNYCNLVGQTHSLLNYIVGI